MAVTGSEVVAGGTGVGTDSIVGGGVGGDVGAVSDVDGCGFADPGTVVAALDAVGAVPVAVGAVAVGAVADVVVGAVAAGVVPAGVVLASVVAGGVVAGGVVAGARPIEVTAGSGTSQSPALRTITPLTSRADWTVSVTAAPSASLNVTALPISEPASMN